MSDIFKKIKSIEPEGNAQREPLELKSEAPEPVIRRSVPSYSEPENDIRTRTRHNYAEDTPQIEDDEISYGWMKITSVIAILLWLAISVLVGVTFFDLSGGGDGLTGMEIAGMALFVVGPLLLILVTIYACRQLAKLSQQVARMEGATQALMTPDETVVSRTALMTRKIKNELDTVTDSSDALLSRLATLHETLEGQVQSINRTAYLAENRTEIIADRLSEERRALDEIAATFGNQMDAMSKLLDENTEKLTDATQQAEMRMQEARMSVEDVASKISETSEFVHSNTVEAASTLTANHAEIAKLAEDLNRRAKELDIIYSKHASDLGSIISTLQTEQDLLSDALESRLSKMREMSLSAQVSAKQLTEASDAGRQTVEALSDAARLTDTAVKQRFADMEDMVRYSNARAESISAKAARRVQDSLSQTRKEIARIEYDMVALQDRLKNAAEADISAALELDQLDQTSTSNTQAKKQKPVSLRPISDPPTAEDAGPDTADQPEKKAGIGLRGLRPAPDPELDKALQDVRDELSIPPGELNIPEPAPELPETPPARDDEVSNRDEDLDMSLNLEIPSVEDLIRPDPDEEITSFDANILRRAVPDDKPVRRRETEDADEGKPWWRKIFSGGDDDKDNLAIDRLTASVKPEIPELTPAEKIVSKLSAMGLTPAAIVDDGCIIEAVNTRKSRGPLAMSDVINHRIAEPVRHLREAIGNDEYFKDDVIQFARQFHSQLGPVEDDREAIRSRLESDQGRAFLLCDAALNI